jgi:hypothetical protein
LALAHRELGPQVVLLGGQLDDRHRVERLEPAARQALGPGVERRQDQEGAERRVEEAQATRQAEMEETGRRTVRLGALTAEIECGPRPARPRRGRGRPGPR